MEWHEIELEMQQLLDPAGPPDVEPPNLPPASTIKSQDKTIDDNVAGEPPQKLDKVA